MCSNGIIQKLEEWCQTIKENGYQVVRIESDIIFKNKPKEITRKLIKGKSYTVFTVANGDRVSDIDLFVYKKSGEDWVLVDKDDDQTNISIVRGITPEESGDYKFVVNAYSFKDNNNAGHYALILAHDDCLNCSHLSNNGIRSNLKYIVCQLETEELEVVHIESDILMNSPKEIYRTLDKNYSYRIAALSSDRIEDVDLEVYRKVDGSWKSIGKDDDFTNVAVVDVKPTTTIEYKFVVTAFKFASESKKSGHYALIFFHD